VNPETIVQQQLDAYNARDLNALMATYAEDAQHFEYPDKLLASGAAQIRERVALRFQEPNLHAQLIHRTVQGNIVIDQELVTRTFPEGPGTTELIALYEVREDKIANARFLFGQKTLQPRG
jgi:hypothetical protein